MALSVQATKKSLMEYRPRLKAYIPLQRKTIHGGSWRWHRPPTPQFRVGDTNMLVSKIAKITFPPTPNLKFVLPNENPQRDSVEYRLRWVPQNFRVGHVHSMLWNMGLGVVHLELFALAQNANGK